MKKIQTRKAFSMVTAIFVIVMMASLTSLIMSLVGKTAKATTQQYQKEQALLLTRSYTELAILYASSYDRSLDCLETINSTFGPAIEEGGYSIRSEIRYIGRGTALVNCGTRTLASLNGGSLFDETVSIVIDTYVSYKDFDDPSAAAAVMDRNITIHRRTLQKL